MNYWLLLLLGWPLLVEAQDVPPIQLNGTPSWTKPLDIASHTWFYDDLSGLPESFPVIRRQEFLPFVQKQQTYWKPPQSKVSTIVTWLVFRVQNTSSTQSAETLLDVGGHGQIDLYTDRGVHMQQTGIYFLPYNVEQWKPIRLPYATD